MTARKATLQDVATAAGVSTATVSRCLNEPDKVKQEVQNKIRSVIKELGYVPHGAARALASRRTQTIGVIIPTIDNAIFSKLILHLQQTLSDNNFTLLIAQSNYSPELEYKEVQEMLSRGVDGLVMMGEARPITTYQLIEQYQIPFINLWSYNPASEYSCIGIDNTAAGQLLAQHMTQLGHKRIGCVWGIQQNNDRTQQRLAGIVSHLHDLKIEFNAKHVAESQYSIEHSKLAFYKLMDCLPDLTAIICANDILALGVMTAARKLSLKIPQALSISGFDNLEILSAVQPSLTTMNAPSAEMGSYAANYLVTQIKAKTRTLQRKELPCSLIVRQTTAISIQRSDQEQISLSKKIRSLKIK